MKFNFDEVIDRKGTNSLKYDFAAEKGKSEDILPLWVADMDFRTVPEVIERLDECVKHGIFGYSNSKAEYFNAVADWFKYNFNWNVKEEWLIKTPGIVFAVAVAVRAFTNEGDSIIIQRPVYYPFGQVIESNK